MIKYFSLIVTYLCLVSCYGQETISVKIINRSTITIDSIVTNNKKINCSIKPHTDNIINLNLKNVDTYHEGAIGMNLYQKGKRKNATIGFHDMGLVSKFDVYVFNEGVFNTDKPLIPKEFYIYFSVAKNQSIDTIFRKKNMISIYEENPNVKRLKFDFSKFKENPTFEAIVSGKKQEFRFDFHDFNDWNSTNEQVTVRKNGKIEYSGEIKQSSYNNEYKQYFTILIDNYDSEIKDYNKKIDISSNCHCIEKIYKSNTTYRVLLDKTKLKDKSVLLLKTNEGNYSYTIKKADIDIDSGNNLSLILEDKKLQNILDR